MKVSVVIPTRNGMPLFAEVLDAVLGQRTGFAFDVTVVDTESTDGTAEEATRRGARLLRVKREEFGHGRTRNLAIEATDGEFVALLVQDATPADDRWLDRLVEAAASGPDVAGSYARQIPRPEADPFVRTRLLHWTAGRDEPVRQRLEAGRTLSDLDPMERLRLCAFDDVSSCLRRSVWAEHPLPDRPFGEDVAWAREVIEAGYSLVYEPRARVLHSHDDAPLDVFRRIYLDHRNLSELFELRTVPTFGHALRAARSQSRLYIDLVRREDIPESRRPDAHVRAVATAWAEALGQWLGALRGSGARPQGAAGRLLDWIDALVDARPRPRADASPSTGSEP